MLNLGFSIQEKILGFDWATTTYCYRCQWIQWIYTPSFTPIHHLPHPFGNLGRQMSRKMRGEENFRGNFWNDNTEGSGGRRRESLKSEIAFDPYFPPVCMVCLVVVSLFSVGYIDVFMRRFPFSCFVFLVSPCCSFLFFFEILFILHTKQWTFPLVFTLLEDLT